MVSQQVTKNDDRLKRCVGHARPPPAGRWARRRGMLPKTFRAATRGMPLPAASQAPRCSSGRVLESWRPQHSRAPWLCRAGRQRFGGCLA
jgi:hypothetical protein